MDLALVGQKTPLSVVWPDSPMESWCDPRFVSDSRGGSRVATAGYCGLWRPSHWDNYARDFCAVTVTYHGIPYSVIY